MALSSAVCARSSVSLKLEKKTSYWPAQQALYEPIREKIKALVTSPLFLLFPRSLHERRVPIG